MADHLPSTDSQPFLGKIHAVNVNGVDYSPAMVDAIDADLRRPTSLVDHDNRKHALLSSSKKEITTKCLGAAQLWLSDPQPFIDTPYAAEGRVVAAMVEKCGKTGEPPPAGYEAAELYQTVIAEEAAKFFDPVVEFECEKIYPLMEARNPYCGGTPDCAIYDGFGGGLTVVDMKWGEGVYVEARNNQQLLDYGRGVRLLMLSLGITLPDKAPVRLIIVQPRWHREADRVRVWEMTALELEGLARQMETTDATIRYHIDARVPLPRTPGDHCRWCPNSATCPEKRALMLSALPDDLETQPAFQRAVTVAEGVVVKSPPALSSAQLTRVLDMAPLVLSWIKDARAYALREALAGRFPGWKVVQGEPGDRAWAKGVDPGLIAAAAKQMGVHPYAEPRLLSPPQVEKAIKAGFPKGMRGVTKVVEERMGNLAPYISRAAGAPVLAKEDDPRPPFNKALALPDDLDEETDP